MDSKIRQIVEMGATRTQAAAALIKYKDVMEAAEHIFDGEFDNVVESTVFPMNEAGSSRTAVPRFVVPDSDEVADADEETHEEDEDDDDDCYVDYDSDPGEYKGTSASADPYAGIFFSKDRREEVIEIEEESEVVMLPGKSEVFKLMSQGEWMKGSVEGSEQSFLFSLYNQLSDGQLACHCGKTVTRQKSDFFTIMEFPAYIAHLRKTIRHTCASCQSILCRACGEKVTEERVKRPAVHASNDLFHCSSLQGVILGMGLGILEQVFTEEQSQAKSELVNQDRTAKRRRTESTLLNASTPDEDTDCADTMYYAGSKTKGGVGYGGRVVEDHSGQVHARAAQKKKDELIGKLMSEIREYLPSLRRPGGGQTSDYMVHPTALAHLRRRFNHICSTLLRNDSLANMSDRNVLYFELLEWLETISNHESLANMMAMPIMMAISSTTVSKSPQTSSQTLRERKIIYEGSSSPRELIEAIAIQAQAALKGLEGIKSSEPITLEMTEEQKRMTTAGPDKGKAKENELSVNPESAKLFEFCTRILSAANAIDKRSKLFQRFWQDPDRVISLRETKGDAFLERLHASLPSISSKGEFQDIGSTEEERYINFAIRARFEYCDLSIPAAAGEAQDVPNYKFYFNNEARLLARSSEIPKRPLAIAKELAILTTNLPVAFNSSIFLRVDESRVDVIKALITGPEGTPYYNGCFLFDIFLPGMYNQVPPHVIYMTTGGGKYRFNPNLYADGKVCLSLLGTWSGPGWIAGQSTLLQVLVSIQSMILCDEPFLNEPGWAAGAGGPKSRAYSANCRRMTVKTAMLANLISPPEPFANVIKTHYRLKAASVKAQLDNWLKDDDGCFTFVEGVADRAASGNTFDNGFAKDVNDMKMQLDRLCTNHT